MKPLLIVPVKIGEFEFVIRYSNKAFYMYITNPRELDNYDLTVNYLYDLAKVGMKSEGKEFAYSFEEFSDLIDPYSEAMEIMMAAIQKLNGDEGDKKKLKGK